MAMSETLREAAVRIPVEELGGHLASLEDKLTHGKLIELVRGEKVIAEVRAPQHPVAKITSGERFTTGEVPNFRTQMLLEERVLDADTTSWICDDRDSGKSAELARGETVVAEASVVKDAALATRSNIREFPDFKARLREWYPNGLLDRNTTEMIREDRDARG